MNVSRRPQMMRRPTDEGERQVSELNALYFRSEFNTQNAALNAHYIEFQRLKPHAADPVFRL